MSEPAVWLSDPMRVAVEDALEEACRFRGWECLKQNVQPDHVHIVVRRQDGSGVDTRQKLKARGGKALNDGFGRREHWWTDGGKVEVVEGAEHLHVVLEYMDKQKFLRVKRPQQTGDSGT